VQFLRPPLDLKAAAQIQKPSKTIGL
jgi:hypothetical protein